ncbi:hypothetical protein D9619_005135 [Psilocybe cf. subviscida]|uniref:Uncharacterized protein n=1 Tax=Psilocybe cf. subviscida TaxID=2480587 RepID=A0A8H5F8V1_9AGAR|nr:hypothetical protein D9619_005135 [Psilocybe cf. subviscida]
MRSALQTLARRAATARQPASQRFASTSTEATQKKAQDALASAQKNAGKFFEGVQKALGPVGDKVGQMLGSYRQPIVYNLSVTKEVLKQIYVKEGMSPPSLDAVRAAYSSLWAQVSNPQILGHLVKSGEIARVGIYGLQAYGIFKIGEIVGRQSLVGYKLK